MSGALSLAQSWIKSVKMRRDSSEVEEQCFIFCILLLMHSMQMSMQRLCLTGEEVFLGVYEVVSGFVHFNLTLP